MMITFGRKRQVPLYRAQAAANAKETMAHCLSRYCERSEEAPDVPNGRSDLAVEEGYYLLQEMLRRLPSLRVGTSLCND